MSTPTNGRRSACDRNNKQTTVCEARASLQRSLVEIGLLGAAEKTAQVEAKSETEAEAEAKHLLVKMTRKGQFLPFYEALACFQHHCLCVSLSAFACVIRELVVSAWHFSFSRLFPAFTRVLVKMSVFDALVSKLDQNAIRTPVRRLATRYGNTINDRAVSFAGQSTCLPAISRKSAAPQCNQSSLLKRAIFSCLQRRFWCTTTPRTSLRRWVCFACFGETPSIRENCFTARQVFFSSVCG